MNTQLINTTHNVPLAPTKFGSRKWLMSAMMLFLLSVGIPAEILLKDITVTPRWPWNGLVDITYSVEIKDYPSDCHPTGVLVSAFGTDYFKNETVEMKTLTGEGIDTPVLAGGPYTIVWDAGKDVPNFNSTDFTVTLQTRLVRWQTNKTYLKINLEDWSYDFRDGGPNLSGDACRTTELWLRRIPKGTFTMGSPSDELGRDAGEVQHQVTLTQAYYIGVFEVTQKQYELVMGSNPSYYKGDTRPVEMVSYDNLRGTLAEGGAGWPAYGHAVDAESFFGRLRAKTGLLFDLPTEAQWEYACRAGTTTALNSGKNLTATNECPNMAEVGRYGYNRSDGKGGYGEHTKVGCYLPNAWGLYDMHGNVWEWCLDWGGDYPASAVTDIVGAASGSYRVIRGGLWNSNYWYYGDAWYCRSASRYSNDPSSRYSDSYLNYVNGFGFRLVCLPD